VFKFLTKSWEGLSAGEQATWNETAAINNLPAYNAFLEVNLNRWRNFFAPTKAYPAAGTGTPPTSAFQIAAAGVRRVNITIVGIAANDLWAWAIFRSTTTPVVPNFNNLIAMELPAAPSGTAYHEDTPLEAGTYYYNFQAFTTTGSLCPKLTERSATVV